MTIRANIAEHPAKDGRFLIESGVVSMVSRDPEYDICHHLAQGMTQDARIEFYRDGILTHSFNSVLKAALRRTSGSRFPLSVKRSEYVGGDNG